jgi:hypothetical protein
MARRKEQDGLYDIAAQMSYHPLGRKGDHRYQTNNPKNVTSAPGEYIAGNLYGDGGRPVRIEGAMMTRNAQQWQRPGETPRLPRDMEAMGDGPAPGYLAMSAQFQGREGVRPDEGMRRGISGGMDMSLGGRQQQAGKRKRKPTA